MREYREAFVCLAWCSLLAAPCFIVAFLLRSFASPFLILAGVLILTPGVWRLISELLLYPEEHLERPPPVYGIPESKVATGLYEEAMALYEKIAAEYPKEIKPYLDMLTIAAKHLKDRQRTIRIYNRAVEHFPDPQKHILLKDAYDAEISRFDPVSEWQQPGSVHLSEKNPDPGAPDPRYFPL